MKRIIVTLATAVAAATLSIPVAAVAGSSNGYEPAMKRPSMPGRTVKIPRRPCAGPQDFNWCYWDAQRNQAYIDPNTGEPFVGGTHSYWAYSTPGTQEGTERVCITYLNHRYNKQYGGCALQTVN